MSGGAPDEVVVAPTGVGGQRIDALDGHCPSMRMEGWRCGQLSGMSAQKKQTPR